METHEINKAYLASLPAEKKKMILAAIANEYGCDIERIEKETTENGAEHLLDYMTEPRRTATYLLMHQWAKSVGLVNVWGEKS